MANNSTSTLQSVNHYEGYDDEEYEYFDVETEDNTELFDIEDLRDSKLYANTYRIYVDEDDYEYFQ